MNTKQTVLDLVNHYMDKEYFIRDRYVKVADLGYTFKWNNRFKRVLGRCNYTHKVISLSSGYVEANLQDNFDKIVDTIKHEISHAITHEVFGRVRNGHGWEWKHVSHIVGNKPDRLKRGVEQVKGKYTLSCDNCNATQQVYRKRTRESACRHCCIEHNNGKFSNEFILKLTLNR